MAKLTPVHYRRLVCIAELLGYSHVRTKGDHLIFSKAEVLRPVVIPMYEQVPVFIIKNFMRTTQISREEYFGWLGQC